MTWIDGVILGFWIVVTVVLLAQEPERTASVFVCLVGVIVLTFWIQVPAYIWWDRSDVYGYRESPHMIYLATWILLNVVVATTPPLMMFSTGSLLWILAAKICGKLRKESK